MGEKIQNLEKLLADLRIYFKEIRNGRSMEEMLGIGKILSQNLLSALNSDNLADYWIEIALCSQINSKYALESANALMRSYRFAGNIFEVLGDPLPDIFGQSLFFQALMSSLLKSLEHLSPSNRINLGGIVKDMSIDAIRAIGWAICDSPPPQRLLLIEMLQYPTLHQILLTLFRTPFVSKTSLSADDLQSIYSVVTLLLQRMNDLSDPRASVSLPPALQFPLENNAKTLSFLPFLTQRPSTIRMARVIANEIPLSCVPLACHRVGLLWSERAFINQGNLEVQTYITAILLTFLQRITREDLFTPPEGLSTNDGSGHQTPLSILSRGVSVHLDSPTTMTRVNGMRIAEKLSEVMSSSSEAVGQSAIHFEELKKYCEDGEGNLILRESSSEAERRNDKESRDLTQQAEHERGEGVSDVQDEERSQGSRDSSSDSEDEFQSYFMKEKLPVISLQDPDQRNELIESKINDIESQEEKTPLLRYLRDCLSSAFLTRLFSHLSSAAELQYTDSSNPDGLYASHKAALVRLSLFLLLSSSSAP
jgi:hypothetical protein